jgi:hypothetical protein
VRSNLRCDVDWDASLLFTGTMIPLKYCARTKQAAVAAFEKKRLYQLSVSLGRRVRVGKIFSRRPRFR